LRCFDCADDHRVDAPHPIEDQNVEEADSIARKIASRSKRRGRSSSATCGDSVMVTSLSKPPPEGGRHSVLQAWSLERFLLTLAWLNTRIVTSLSYFGETFVLN